jgi:NTP pyrophosphatase (non-canonical NTP hydrolase)|tara:strand:+ start:562 stop:924 length:363 start_codon:yes stop_codon:yes gene_type:complete
MPSYGKTLKDAPMTDLVSFNLYQESALETAIFSKDNALPYLSLGLAAEAGEVADKVAKYYRGDKPLNVSDLMQEVGDVLWFAAVLSEHFGYTLERVALMNMNKLQSRKERGTLMGSGDNR